MYSIFVNSDYFIYLKSSKYSLELNERRRTRQHQRKKLRSPVRRPSSTELERELITTVESTHVLLNLVRAVTARTLFIVHSIASIWRTVKIRDDNSIWGFVFIAISIIFEGAHTVIMRAGVERKCFCPSVLAYILATAPPIWLLELTLCEWHQNGDHTLTNEEFQLKLLEQLLLVILIIGRWLLPFEHISKEEILNTFVSYFAVSSDVVIFFDMFKEKEVWNDTYVQKLMLTAWTLSLLQFAFPLTINAVRKPAPHYVLTKTFEDFLLRSRKPTPCDAFYDINIWAIALSICLHDMPFLFVRVYLMLDHHLITYTLIFFTCKNALTIVLHTCRGVVIFNDRYLHPRLESVDANLIRQQIQALQPIRRLTRTEQQSSNRDANSNRQRNTTSY